jgi:P pilus assembly chaperone PapD
MDKPKFINGYSANKLFTHYISPLSKLTILAILLSTNLPAQGNMVVFPKRVVFEGNQKIHELNLANTGQDTARYVISFVQIRMKENGEFENITQPDSGQFFADSYLRIFPRTVTLAPNESQLIKIQLIKSNLLAEGEYRSHLYFRLVPDNKPLLSSDKEAARDSTSISVRLVPIFGMTIPVIIRVGESTTKVSLSNLSFEMTNDTTPTFNFVINRTGNMSTYGDIKVDHISPAGKITEVCNIQGVAVYTPNSMRRCVINLEKIPGIDYHKGKLRVVYLPQRDDKVSLISEAELQLK